MIERNENFKEKMLRKSRGIVDRKRKLLEDSSLDLKDSSRQEHTEGKVYERMGHLSQLSRLEYLEDEPLPTHHLNTFRPD